MLRTDDILGAQPKKFTHHQKGHVHPSEQPEGTNREIVIRPGKYIRPTHGLQSPFALDSNYSPQKNPMSKKHVNPVQLTNNIFGEKPEEPRKQNTPQRPHIEERTPQQKPSQQYNEQGSQSRVFPTGQSDGNRTPVQKSGKASRQSSQQFNAAPIDSLDILNDAVARKTGLSASSTASETSSTYMKKALHNFYGITPPPTGSSVYREIKVQKPNNQVKNEYTDSFYQSMSKNSHERAQKSLSYGVNMNNFYGLPVGETESYQKNQNKFYDVKSPIMQTPTIQTPKPMIEGLQSKESFTVKSNMNKSMENLPYHLDPISHERVYRNSGMPRNARPF